MHQRGQGGSVRGHCAANLDWLGWVHGGRAKAGILPPSASGELDFSSLATKACGRQLQLLLGKLKAVVWQSRTLEWA
jgi:hypothetical protein